MAPATEFWVEKAQLLLAHIASNFTTVLTICTLGVIIVYLTFKTPKLIVGLKYIWKICSFIVHKIRRRKFECYKRKREGYLKEFLSPRARKKLQDKYDSFRLYMKPVDLIPKLVTRGLLKIDSRTYKQIKQEQLAEDKNELIIKDVLKMNFEQLERFKECLIESGQEALANFVPELDQEEVECFEQNKCEGIKAQSQKKQNQKEPEQELPCLAQGEQHIQHNIPNPEVRSTIPPGDYITTKLQEMTEDIEHFKHRFQAMVKDVDDKRQKLTNNVKEMEKRKVTQWQLTEMKTEFEELKEQLETMVKEVDDKRQNLTYSVKEMEKRNVTQLQLTEMKTEFEELKEQLETMVKDVDDKTQKLTYNVKEMEKRNVTQLQLTEMKTEFEEFTHQLETMVNKVDDKTQKLSYNVKEMEKTNVTQLQLTEMKTEFGELTQQLEKDRPTVPPGDYITTKLQDMANDVAHFKHTFKAMVKDVDDKRQTLTYNVQEMEKRNATQLQLNEMKTELESFKRQLETTMSLHSKELQDQIGALWKDSSVASRMVEERKTEMQRLKRESELFEQRINGIISRLEKSYEDKITSINETTELTARELMEDNEKLNTHISLKMKEFQDRLTEIEHNYKTIMENIDYNKKELSHTFQEQLLQINQEENRRLHHENTDLKGRVNVLEDHVNTLQVHVNSLDEMMTVTDDIDKSRQTLLFHLTDFLKENYSGFEEYLLMHQGNPFRRDMVMHVGTPLREDMEVDTVKE